MSLDTLLSLSIGVPVAVLAMVLLFRVETNRVAGVPTPRLLDASAAGTTVLLVLLVVARFIHYA